MPVVLTWHEVAVRLGLSLLAGGLIGLDRGEHGRPAGLRTTLLVCLAAAVAMIQANLLLGTTGRAGNSFVMLDLMRLPLGILTGMGFIGGGAILRHEGFVHGLTTAATLWFVTVIGLCFGGGQISLGVAASVLGILVVSGLRWFDYRMKQEQHGILLVTTERHQPTEAQIRASVEKSGYKISLQSIESLRREEQVKLEFNLQWRGIAQKETEPAFMGELLRDTHIVAARWKLS